MGVRCYNKEYGTCVIQRGEGLIPILNLAQMVFRLVPKIYAICSPASCVSIKDDILPLACLSLAIQPAPTSQLSSDRLTAEPEVKPRQRSGSFLCQLVSELATKLLLREIIGEPSACQ